MTDKMALDPTRKYMPVNRTTLQGHRQMERKEVRHQMRWQRVMPVLMLIAFQAIPYFAKAATMPPEFKSIVTFIFPADPQGGLLRDPNTNSPIPYGTGFFVAVKNDTATGIYGYLVTSKHVLKDPTGKDFVRVYVRLNLLKGGTEFVPLDLVQNAKRVVYTHPDSTVDIAVIPALPPQSLFDFKAVPDDMISTKASFDEFNIAEGSDVFFVGLFTTYYGDHKNNPIFRFGRVAMFPDERILWGQPPQLTQLYLVETQSYGGNSGSPVFFALGSDRDRNVGFIVGPPVLKLAGVMSGRFNDVTPTIGYMQSPTASLPVTLPNIGIAAVAPAYLLHDILFSDELKKMRAENPIPAPKPEK